MKDKKKAMKNIRFIIFDYGGVIAPKALTRELSKKLSKKTGKDEELIHKALKKKLKKFELGKIKCSVFWSEFSERTEIKITEIRDILFNIIKPKKEMLHFLSELKNRKQYKLILLSNNIRDISRHLVRNYAMKKYFDRLFFSCYIGKMKPKKAIYKYVLKKLGASPHEVVFIDDKEKNIVGAESVGICGVLFRNLEQLKKDLRNLGIKI